MPTSTFTFPNSAKNTSTFVSGVAPFTLVLQPSGMNVGTNIIGNITYGLSGSIVSPISYNRKYTYCSLTEALSHPDYIDSRSNFYQTFYNSAFGPTTSTIVISATLIPSLEIVTYTIDIYTQSPWLTKNPFRAGSGYIFNAVHLIKSRAWGTNNDQIIVAEGKSSPGQILLFNTADLASAAILKPDAPNVATPTPTPTPTLTPTPTPTPTVTPTVTPTLTPTPTPTVTATPTPTVTLTPTPTPTPTLTPTPTPTLTLVPTATPTATPTVTPTRTPTPTPTPTVTPTLTPTPTVTPTLTPTPTPTPTLTPTPTVTPTITPTPTVTPTLTPTPTVTPTLTPTPTPTPTLTPTPTVTPTITPTPTLTPTPTPTPTLTPTPTPTLTPTPTPTPVLYSIQASNSAGGYSVSVDGDGSGNPIYRVAGTYAIAAVADSGYHFTNWYINSGNPIITFFANPNTTMYVYDNCAITAIFAQDPTPTPTSTPTLTPTPTPTATPTSTPTFTPEPNTPTPTPTLTPTPTPTITPTPCKTYGIDWEETAGCLWGLDFSYNDCDNVGQNYYNTISNCIDPGQYQFCAKLNTVNVTVGINLMDIGVCSEPPPAATPTPTPTPTPTLTPTPTPTPTLTPEPEATATPTPTPTMTLAPCTNYGIDWEETAGCFWELSFSYNDCDNVGQNYYNSVSNCADPGQYQFCALTNSVNITEGSNLQNLGSEGC